MYLYRQKFIKLNCTSTILICPTRSDMAQMRSKNILDNNYNIQIITILRKVSRQSHIHIQGNILTHVPYMVFEISTSPEWETFIVGWNLSHNFYPWMWLYQCFNCWYWIATEVACKLQAILQISTRYGLTTPCCVQCGKNGCKCVFFFRKLAGPHADTHLPSGLSLLYILYV